MAGSGWGYRKVGGPARRLLGFSERKKWGMTWCLLRATLRQTKWQWQWFKGGQPIHILLVGWLRQRVSDGRDNFCSDIFFTCFRTKSAQCSYIQAHWNLRYMVYHVQNSMYQCTVQSLYAKTWLVRWKSFYEPIEELKNWKKYVFQEKNT